MRAITYRSYGSPDHLRLEEVDRPFPRESEVLIAVRAAAVNPLDWRLLRGRPYLARWLLPASQARPARPGRDVAGVVETVGARVDRFAPGDAVFGTCRGAFAEYACASPATLARKPESVSFAEAASLPIAGLTALRALRVGQGGRGRKVLINGASGGVGTFAVQLAKAQGAHVTGVCSARHLELVRGLGADRAIDYTREDFTRRGERFDLVVDCISNHPLASIRRILAEDGRCAIVGGHGDWSILGRAFAAPLYSAFAGRSFRPVVARMKEQDLTLLADQVASRQVRPVLDVRSGLEAVPEAFRHVEGGHATGKVVIRLD